MGRNVIIFGVDMSSSVHVDNKIKDKGLDDATLTRKNIPCISFTQSNKRFVSRLHHNGSNNFLFVNTTKIYQFKATLWNKRLYTMFS